MELPSPGVLYPHILSVGVWVFDSQSWRSVASNHIDAEYVWILNQKATLRLIVISAALSSSVSGLVVHWVGRYRECILFGWMVWAIGLGLFSTLDRSSGIGQQVGYGLLTGVGVGNTLQPYVTRSC